MIERAMERFDLYPAKIMCDSAYGPAEMLGWLVYEHGIKPHVTVFDKSARKDGTFSREDFTYDHEQDVYLCPGGKALTTTGTHDDATLLYRASKNDCAGCARLQYLGQDAHRCLQSRMVGRMPAHVASVIPSSDGFRVGEEIHMLKPPRVQRRGSGKHQFPTVEIAVRD